MLNVSPLSVCPVAIAIAGWIEDIWVDAGE